MKIDGPPRKREATLESAAWQATLRLSSVETPLTHPLFSTGYDAASFMFFGGPKAHGHSGQAFSKKRKKWRTPSCFRQC